MALMQIRPDRNFQVVFQNKRPQLRVCCALVKAQSKNQLKLTEKFCCLDHR